MQAQLQPFSLMSFETDGPEARDVYFRTIAVIPFGSPVFSLRAMDPERSLLLLGLPSSFHLLNWETHQRTIVNMLGDEEEELVRANAAPPSNPLLKPSFSGTAL